jgi:hypothetical protein
MGGPIHLADSFLETTPLSPLQTGIIIFRRMLPESRKLVVCFFFTPGVLTVGFTVPSTQL